MIVIGYSKGIGNAIVSYFNCRGVGKEEGCDISTEQGRTKIVHECVNQDVIILSAHDSKNKNAQLETLFQLYKSFKDSPKHIIVIGSCTQDKWSDEINEYGAYKSAIDYAAMNMARHRNECVVTNIRLGLTATETSNTPKNKGKKCIDPTSVAVLIKSIIELPADIVPASLTVIPSRNGIVNATI